MQSRDTVTYRNETRTGTYVRVQACALPELGIWGIIRSLTAVFVTVEVGGCISRTIFCPLLQAWSPSDWDIQGDRQGSQAVDSGNKAMCDPAPCGFLRRYGSQTGTLLHARLDGASFGLSTVTARPSRHDLGTCTLSTKGVQQCRPPRRLYREKREYTSTMKCAQLTYCMLHTVPFR